MEIEAALKEAGVPKENLIAIPKTVYMGGINEIEGYFWQIGISLRSTRYLMGNGQAL